MHARVLYEFCLQPEQLHLPGFQVQQINRLGLENSWLFIFKYYPWRGERDNQQRVTMQVYNTPDNTVPVGRPQNGQLPLHIATQRKGHQNTTTTLPTQLFLH